MITEQGRDAPMDPSSAVRQGDWFVLFDPNWSGNPTDKTPPVEVMVGGWRLEEDGELGPFRPNPGYRPQTPNTPSDPIDALLRLIAAGEDRGDRIIPTLKRTVVEIACDDQNQPRVALSPDDIPCVVVVTAEIHKHHLPVSRWLPVLGSRLSEIVPAGTDVWFNPSSDHRFRLDTDVIRAADQA
ncbi:type VII secretion system-associated protein [Nocardia rhamnosiphila]